MTVARSYPDTQSEPDRYVNIDNVVYHLDDIEVDEAGKCSWTDVANALTYIKLCIEPTGVAQAGTGRDALNAIYDALGDLNVDASGKCRWSDVANIQREVYQMAIDASPAPSSWQPTDEGRRWTEDELALAFFDYSACSEARCTFKRIGGCHCVHAAYQAVNMVKHVLPRSFPMGVSLPSTQETTLQDAAQRLVDELLSQHIARDKFFIGIGTAELHAYTQLPRVDCRADIIGGWPVVWHFNVGPIEAYSVSATHPGGGK